MIKVIHIIGSLEKGGAERILENIVHSEVTDFDHVVLSMTLKDSEYSRIANMGVSVIELGIRGANQSSSIVLRGLEVICGIYKLIRVVRKEKPDIIHTWMYHSDVVGGLVGKCLRIPTIWGIFLSNLDKSYYKKSTYLIIKLAGWLSNYLPTKIVSCSIAGIASHKGFGYPTDKIMTIPVAVNTKYFVYTEKKRQNFRSCQNVPLNHTVVGMLARWDPQKDFEVFLKAVSRISEDRQDLHFWLAGGYGITESNDELVSLVERCGAQSHVKYFDMVDDLVAFYSALDIFTLTSHGEGFPTVVAEAMSCGLPCIASNVGDVSVMFEGKSGILLDRNDPNLLVEQWLFLINGGQCLREDFGERARSRIIALCEVDEIRGRYHHLYKSVVENNP